MQTAAKNLCVKQMFLHRLSWKPGEKNPEKRRSICMKPKTPSVPWRLNRTTQAVNHPHLGLIIINADFQCIFIFINLWQTTPRVQSDRSGGGASERQATCLSMLTLQRILSKSHLNSSNLQENKVTAASEHLSCRQRSAWRAFMDQVLLGWSGTSSARRVPACREQTLPINLNSPPVTLSNSSCCHFLSAS